MIDINVVAQQFPPKPPAKLQHQGSYQSNPALWFSYVGPAWA